MQIKTQSRAPLALAAVAFAAGIWLAGSLHSSSAVWGWSTVALGLCAIAAVANRNSRSAQLAAMFAVLCAGAFARVATPVPHLVVPPPEFLTNENVEIVGHVTSDGTLAAIDESRERFDIKTESIAIDGEEFLQPVGIRPPFMVPRVQLGDTESVST